MQYTILLSHVIIGILFSISVLMQDKGVGFGTAVGGAGGGAVFTTKRGAAKILHNVSVVLAVLFLLTALAYVVVPVDETSTAAPVISSPAAENAIEVVPSAE